MVPPLAVLGCDSETPLVADKSTHQKDLGLISDTFEYTTEQVERYVIDPELSRAIAWKYDKRILPAIFFMYLFASLDRGNLGNAKTGTLEKDLHMKGNQYNNVITITTAAYSAFCIFGGLLTRRFGPTRMLPLYMLCCGSMSVLNAAARNYNDIMVIRFFLGMFEGLFASSVIVYLASIYTRGELGKRMAIWYSASAVSGAFSGLLAYGVFQAHAALAGWKILLMIQGGMTIVAALLAAWMLPNGPQHAVFLSPLEKEVAVIRLLKDTSKHIDALFRCSEFFAPLHEWKFYVLAAFAVCYGTSSITANTFLPQIIQRFNLGTLKTNLYTVAPNIAATLFLWACAWASDRTRQRSFFLILSMSLSLVGYVILAALPISALGTAYFACFLISMGSFVPSPIFHSWHNNNEPSENGRAFRTGFYVLAGNSGGLVSANIFLDSDAPKYMHALIISASLQLVGMCLLLGIRTHMVLENRRRNREQGVKWTNRDVPTADLKEGPDSPGFRYFL
ncbi:MFS general substrate transporter [Favolaschia claudopus]|uniref:MFS general substrate transporter n=1 Tax=Favolaschia claudopus TaxID=2862362 RepID=A0AAW0DYG2_9AGAR